MIEVLFSLVVLTREHKCLDGRFHETRLHAGSNMTNHMFLMYLSSKGMILTRDAADLHVDRLSLVGFFKCPQFGLSPRDGFMLQYYQILLT